MPECRIIAGSGRSGTTWVLDSIASANNLRPIFEPLHPAVSAVGDRYAHLTLRAGEDHPDLEKFLKTACLADTRSLWTTYRARKDRLFPHWSEFVHIHSVKRLYRRWERLLRRRRALAAAARRPEPMIKCIRANLMLGWLGSIFDCRIVLIVRHPGAVIESKLRLGAVWDPDPVTRRYRADRQLRDLTQGRYEMLLNTRLSTVQALALNWVIENQWPIANAAADGVSVFYYEDLLAHPADNWGKLCGALGLATAPTTAQLVRPSQQSSAASRSVRTTAALEPRWQRALSREQRKEIQDILDAVEFRTYHMDRAVPEVLISRNPQSIPEV